MYNMHGAPLCHAMGCRKHTNLSKCQYGIFCHKHAKNIDIIRFNSKTLNYSQVTPTIHYEPIGNKYDMHNMHGSPICHAVGCRKHKKLLYRHNGIFCNKHAKSLYIIRQNLNVAKSSNDIVTEDKYRKQCHAGHMVWKLKIEKQIKEQNL